MTAPTDHSPIKPESPPSQELPTRPSRRAAMAAIFAVLALVGALVAVTQSGDGDEPAPVVPTTVPPTTEAMAATTVAPMPPPEHVAVLTGNAHHNMNVALDDEGHLVFLVYGQPGEPPTVGRCLDMACADVEFNRLPPETADWRQGTGDSFRNLMLGPDDTPVFGARATDGAFGFVTCGDPLCTRASFAPLVYGTVAMASDRQGLPIGVGRGTLDIPATSPTLEIVRCVDAECSEVTTGEIVDEDAGSLIPLGVATNVADTPMVAVVDGFADALRLYMCEDPVCSSWSVQVHDMSDAATPLQEGTRIDFGPDGRPYLALNRGTMRMLTCSDPGCSQGLEVADVAVAWDRDYGLAVRYDGRPVLAYSARNRSLDEYRIEVAVCDDPTCASGSIAVIADDHGAFSTDLALDGDIPVIGYAFQSRDTAYVYRCTDPLCENGAVSVSRWDQSTVEARSPVGPPPGRLSKVAQYEPAGPPFSGGVFGVVSHGDDPVVTAQSCGDLSKGWDCVPLVGRVSSEGIWSWETVDLGETGLHFMAVSAIDGERAVIAGEKCGEDWICVPKAWITDFETWTEAEVRGCEEGCDAWIEQVIPFAGGWAAIGEMDGYSAAWATTDGLAWVPAEIEGVFEDDTWLYGAAAFGDGLLGHGEACLEELDWACLPALWSSPDGAVWTRVETEGLEGADLQALIARPDRAVLFGEHCPEGSRLCALSSWTSLDGVSWTGAPIGDLPGGWIRAIPFRDGFALSMSLFDLYFGESYPVLAVSEDLASWEVFEVDEAEFESLGPALWTDGDRILLAGTYRSGPSIWEWIP